MSRLIALTLSAAMVGGCHARFKKAVPFRFARAGPKKDDSKEANEDAAYYAQARSLLP